MATDKIRILIIEDDKEDFLITQDIFSQIPNGRYKLDWECDYHSALFRIADQEHDIYLVDYNLGANSGVELVKQCTASGINLPFVFLTGMNDVGIDMNAMQAGAVDYLIKDELTPRILERSIRYSLKQKATEIALLNSNTTKDKLFSIISHDLRSPIATFMSTIDLLTSDNEIDEEMKNRFLIELGKTSKSTFNLLDNLLCWSRSQIGSITSNPTNVKLKYLVDEIFELFRNQAKLKSIQLINNIEDNYESYADINQLRLIARNLISNALKFTSEMGNVIVSAEKQGDKIEISVADNGVGMDEFTKGSILKPHNFNASQGTNNEQGSGLGLKIVKEFVEKCGGKLWVESEPGIGSIFYFTLPVRENES